MMSKLGFDILAAIILAITAAIGAYAPMFLMQRDKSAGGTGRSLTLILGNMFSAGVMVSAGFCHLLGEAVKQMPAMQFSLATFLCGLGYLLTLVADKAATLLSGLHSTTERGLEVVVGIDLAERVRTPQRHPPPKERFSQDDQSLLLPNNNEGLTSSTSPAGSKITRSTSDTTPLTTTTTTTTVEHRNNKNLSTSGGSRIVDLEDGTRQHPRTNSFELDHQDLHSTSSQHHSHHHHHLPPIGEGVSFITAVLMAVALCFHSLLEGAAMGAQPTLSNSLHIFIAIVSHKGLAAYALGSSIAESNVDMNRFWAVVLPFTFASPVGIFVGYVISDAAQGVGAAAISALASGTFLYVAFMEVIPRELHDPRYAGKKLGALLLGFGLMSLLAIWA